MLVILPDASTYEYIIVQNPPCIPVLAVCYLASILRGTKVIIDWHNYGYSILRVNNANKIVVFLAKFYEKFFGPRTGFAHVCVSKNMQTDLIH